MLLWVQCHQLIVIIVTVTLLGMNDSSKGKCLCNKGL